MNYWLVRAKWGGISKKAEFINNDEWINGYEEKYLEIVNRVEVEDVLLLAEESSITHYGVCIDNPKDGKHLTVDKWILIDDYFSFSIKGDSAKSIVKINDEKLINSINVTIEHTNQSRSIKIKSIYIEGFTIFQGDNSLEFSDKLNVIIGENNAGKTHLLKLLYSMIIGINESVDFYNSYDFHDFHDFHDEEIHCMDETPIDFLTNQIQESLLEIFKPEDLNNLISYQKQECFITINLERYLFPVHICDGFLDYSFENTINKDIPDKIFIKNSIFIPAKEMLSFYEGFIPLHENRETSFDKIYYYLAKALSLSNLKNIESYPAEYKLLCKIEEILEGKISLERGRFYLVTHKNNRKTEISLIAEGFRKIGMIAQLLANGSLTKNSILFWDEPETNLNPRLIKKMAEVLVELSRAGMQIFIATHSLFLVKEIEILRNKQDKVKYFGLGLNEDKEIRVSQSEEFEYLEDIVILDEEFDQDSRFLAKEEG